MNKKYRVKDCFLMKKIMNENVVVARGPYALEFGGTLVLNDTCALLWDKLKEYCEIDELCRELVAVYGIDYSTAEKDTIACINKMKEYDLLEVES